MCLKVPDTQSRQSAVGHCQSRRGASVAVASAVRLWHYTALVETFRPIQRIESAAARLWEKPLRLAVQVSWAVHEERNGKSTGNSLESVAIVSMISPILSGFFSSFFSASMPDFFYQTYSLLEGDYIRESDLKKLRSIITTVCLSAERYCLSHRCKKYLHDGCSLCSLFKCSFLARNRKMSAIDAASSLM